MNNSLLITVFTDDRPGVIKILSDVVLSHHGNWLESSFSKLCGQFAGIVRIDVADKYKTDLINALQELTIHNIDIHFPRAKFVEEKESTKNPLNIQVEANDREGIVDEIASALAKQQINIIKMDTHCESASMAGYNLFKASLQITLPNNMAISDLENSLEQVSDDLMVSII